MIQLINHEAPVINGDGFYSRDFTYIDNVIRMNFLALTTSNESALNQIYNTAVGNRTTLIQLVHSLKIIYLNLTQRLQTLKKCMAQTG